MKLGRSVGNVSKAIGLDTIISSIITIALIAGVIIGVFSFKSNETWGDMVKDSSNKYEYSPYDEKYTKGVSHDVKELYKNARVLYGYSDIDNLSLENYSSGNTMIYGWDERDSERLNKSINEVLEEVSTIKNETSFNKKDILVITESLKMIRYFCNNQQVIDKVRMEMKLVGKVSKLDSNLNIYIINNGAPEYFEGYSNNLNALKSIFDENKLDGGD